MTSNSFERIRISTPSPRRQQQEVEFHSSFRFRVAVEGINHAVFTEFKLPSLQVETLDVKEGGQNTYIHRLPVRVNAGKATLKYGITQSLDLLGWYLEVLTGDLDKAKRSVDITMFNVKREPLLTWSLREAYPTKWDGPTLKSDSSTVAIDSIELIHHGIIVQVYS